MVSQISRTYDFDRKFWKKGAAYLRVFTVTGILLFIAPPLLTLKS